MKLQNPREQLSVMLVDDNHIDHFLVSALLRQQGFRQPVISFQGAAEALAFLRHQETAALPHLVLLDINMPELNGFDFLEAFEHLPASVRDHCTIVMLSSSYNYDDISRAKANPYVREYFEKPLTEEKLISVLHLFQ